MSSSSIRGVSVCVLATLTIAGAAFAAPPTSILGRVFSLSAHVVDQHPAGAGTDVEIGVDLTTVRDPIFIPTTTFTTVTSLARNKDVSMAAGVESTQQPLIDPFPASAHLGGPFTVTSHSSHGITSTFYRFGSFTHFTSYTGITGAASDAVKSGRSLKAPGHLPAIDWGDASTLPVSTLPAPPQSTTTTSSGRVFRHWRASFSHHFADQLPHIVHVASGCCADSSLAKGNVVTGTGSWAYTHYRAVDLSSASGHVRMGSSNLLTNTSFTPSGATTFTFFFTFNTTTSYNGHLDRTSDSRRISEFKGFDQVTASVVVAPYSAIPTVGSYGLGLLAVALLATGTLLLRRH